MSGLEHRLAALAGVVFAELARAHDLRPGEPVIVYRGNPPRWAHVGIYVRVEPKRTIVRRPSFTVVSPLYGVGRGREYQLRRVSRRELAALYKPGDRIGFLLDGRDGTGTVVELAAGLVVVRADGEEWACGVVVCPDRCDPIRAVRVGRAVPLTDGKSATQRARRRRKEGVR